MADVVFDSLDLFPEGLLPIGDSMCHFNPAYGQGMTSACRQAMGLRSILQETVETGKDLTDIWQKVFPVSYQETRAPWLFATLADFMHPKCTGDFPQEEKETLAIYQHVLDLALEGDTAAAAVAQAIGNLKTPLAVLEEAQWAESYADSKAAKEAQSD